MTFLRAKIVGQYELHDPLKSRAMVSITVPCTTTPRRTFSCEETCESRCCNDIHFSPIVDHSRPSLSLPSCSRASDASFFYYLARSPVSSLSGVSKQEKRAHQHLLSDLRSDTHAVFLSKDISLSICCLKNIKKRMFLRILISLA